MTSSSNRSEHHEHDTPAELRSVASLADRLGAHERASAAPDFEDRLFRSTGHLLGDPPRSIPFPSREQQVAATMGWRLAAAVVFAAALGLTVVGWRVVNSGGSRAAPTGPVAVGDETKGRVDVAELEADLDRLFSSTAWTTGASSELASLASDVDSLSGVNDPWSGPGPDLENLVTEDSL